jgi:two-component system response regulator HydG
MNNKILIIDDNIIYCNALKNHLLQKEFKVRTCISNTEFQEKIDIREFDIILLDMKLKDAKGLDILQFILKISPDKKIIIISSYLDDKSISMANELGAYKCIHKNSQLFDELDFILKRI